MAESLLWKYVTQDQVEELNHLHELKDCKDYLLKLFGHSGIPPEQEQLLFDLYSYMYCFTKEQSFNLAKTSVFLSIIHLVLSADFHLQPHLFPPATSSTTSLTQSFARFKQLVLQHAVERPPYSAGIFEAKDVKEIIQFTLHHYYRQYDLYQTIFLPQESWIFEQRLPNELKNPIIPRPLQSAIPLQVHVIPAEPVEEEAQEQQMEENDPKE